MTHDEFKALVAKVRPAFKSSGSEVLDLKTSIAARAAMKDAATRLMKALQSSVDLDKTFKADLLNLFRDAIELDDPKAFITKLALAVEKDNKTKGPIAPGQTRPIAPGTPLTAKAQQHGPTPERQAQIDAINAEIKKHDQLIADLKAKQAEAAKAKKVHRAALKAMASIPKKSLELFSYIEEHCGEFIEAMTSTGGKLLFRGQENAVKAAYVGYPRTNRRAKDSDPEAQKLLDKYLSIAGFKTIRSNCLFTTPDYEQAEEYGTVYAIFPKDGFTFLWSRTKDLVASEADIKNVIYSVADIELPDASDWDIWVTEFKQITNDPLGWLKLHPSRIKKIGEDKVQDVVDRVKERGIWDRFNQTITEYKSTPPGISKAYSFIKLTNLFTLINEQWVPFLHPTEMKVLGESIKSAGDAIKSWNKAIISNDGKVTASDSNIADAIVNHYGFKQDDLDSALKLNGEIGILGEYVAIKYLSYAADLERYFSIPESVRLKATSEY